MGSRVEIPLRAGGVCQANSVTTPAHQIQTFGAFLSFYVTVRSKSLLCGVAQKTQQCLWMINKPTERAVRCLMKLLCVELALVSISKSGRLMCVCLCESQRGDDEEGRGLFQTLLEREIIPGFQTIT